MKTDYITSGSTLPPYLAYPRFLLGMNIRLTAKEIYAIMLDMILNSEAAQTDKRGRRYLAFYNKTIAEIIDRTPQHRSAVPAGVGGCRVSGKEADSPPYPLSHLYQAAHRGE